MVFNRFPCLGKFIHGNCGKQAGNRLAVPAPVFSCNALKRIIKPEQMAVVIGDGVRNSQFCDQLLLNLTIMGRKRDHFVQNTSAVNVVNNQFCRKICQDSHRNKHPGRNADKINPDSNDNKEQNQQDRHPQQTPQLTGQFYFIHRIFPPH